MASDFLDAHYQPLIQRTSMGNIYSSSKSTSSVESGNIRANDAPQVVLTGTKGLLLSQKKNSKKKYRWN